MLISLALSVLLWVYVESQMDRPKPAGGPVAIPVALDNLPQDFVAEDPPISIPLIPDGSPGSLSRLIEYVQTADSPAKIRVDMSQAQVGTHEYPFQIELPEDVAVTFLRQPKSILITLDKVIDQKLKVQVETYGTAPEGFLSGAQETVPSVVTVRGPSKKVRDIARARVLLNLSDVRAGKPVELAVDLLKANDVSVGSSVVPTPSRVQVYAALSPRPDVARLLVSPTLSGQPAPGFRIVRIECEPNQVLVRGSSQLLSGRYSIETKPVEIGGLKTTKEFMVALDLPEVLTTNGPTAVRARVVVERIQTGP